MKLIKFANIIKLGEKFGTSDSERKRIKLSNMLSLLFIANNLFYSILFSYLKIPEYSGMLYATIILYIFTFFLNKYGKHKAGRLLLITNGTFIVLYYDILMGKAANVYILFVAFAAFPFVFFDIKEKFSLLYGLSLGPISFIVSELYRHFIKQVPILSEESLYIISVNIFFTTFIIILVVVFNFERLSNKAESALRQAKEQQDGDYFLTSLIVQPLFRNPESDDRIQTEYFAKQKKTFSFQKKHRDLGGDINIIGKLNFRGNDYTLFVNADAMGKSMQGAGGAIVLGTVVNSLLTRNRHIRIPLHPKEWLIKMFNELQEVFVEFDGSMLISCFVGLINNNSGKMFYFNCEHPSAILYRDGKAQFINDKPEYKIGSPMFPENYKIEIFEFTLQPGDNLIAGSDGRDDINIPTAAGERSINTNEKQILRMIELSDANLESVYTNLLKLGEPIDDISFIKIAYIATEDKKDEKQIDLDLIRTMVKKSNFRAALEELESTEEEILVAEFIYLRTLCLERIGLGTVALSILEKHSSILNEYLPAQHLKALIYYRAGDYKKARQVLDFCINTEISTEQTKKLLKKIDSRL
ncbi:MAG: SpoIIE family protein phosphatase [Leptospiraceae bacterium]|nr:SpoIIE family protein phosphatase [Leptospiraceae bacterium]